MSKTTNVAAAPTAAAPSTAERPRARRAKAVAAAVVGALAVWIIAEAVLGTDVQAPGFDGTGRTMDLGPGQVVFTSALVSMAGWGLLALIERWSSRAHKVWAAIATVVFVLSLGGPLSGEGVTGGSRAALLLMHVVVAAVLIPLLYRSSTARSN